MNLPAGQFHCKRVLDDAHGAVCEVLRHRNTDRVLRARLGDQSHGDTCLLQSRKHPVCRPGHTDHPCSFEIDQCHAVDLGDALDAGLGRPGRLNPAPAMIGREGIADDQRDFIVNNRAQSLWVNDLGAEVGKLHRLVVGQSIDDPRLRNPVRIRTHYAVNVRPDRQLGGVAQRGKNRRRIIAAITSERRLQAILV